MRTQIVLNGSASPAVRYLGWAPVQAQVRLSDTTGATGPVAVTLRNANTATGGQLEFYRALPGAPTAELELTLPLSGAPVAFLLAGRWPRASVDDGDAVVEVVADASGQMLGTLPLMVRIRKDATTLTTAERDRFCAALATFNNAGMGRFRDFRNVHTAAGDPEAHGFAGFLPWHRAFLLDLERELQQIDPRVAMPYWRFDRPAPSLFNRDFMGVTRPPVNTVQFSTSNPLQFWATDGVPGIVRRPQFNTQTQPSTIPGFPPVLSELRTLNLGTPDGLYAAFRSMEGDPHGYAHSSFTGSISDIPTAAKDPLFFLLHANVDRLWAKWQWSRRRFDVTSSRTFTTQGDNPPRIGHRLDDTMWPWNGVTGRPRPPSAPGGTMAVSPMTNAPGLRPRVRDMIDYQGKHSLAARLGFDYDDVPFQSP